MLLPVLELQGVSLNVGTGDSTQTLLHDVSVSIPQGHFTAILGPSGCGKSTFLKAIAGLLPATSGTMHWKGKNVEEHDLEPHEIGYVPQFGITHDHLTVRECITAAFRLRVAGCSEAEREARITEILDQTGLEEIADRRSGVLSGGQKRRVALALELVSSPALLLCDEVTSGLDPKAEDEMVHLMQMLSREHHRIVLHVTHSLRHLAVYDSVLLPGSLLLHYFQVENPEDLFPALTSREPDEWHQSWQEHGAGYQIQSAGESGENEAEQTEPATETTDEIPGPPPPLPGMLTQIGVLFLRRWKIFFRDRGQLFLQLALMLGFPFLVVIFAWDGLPEIQNQNLRGGGNILEQVVEQSAFLAQSTKAGGLVSGLIMFQVVLLTLMGSNNSAREIASERLIFEKEKFGGLRPLSYIISKAMFLAMLVAAQSLWMAVFVNMICQFPGSLETQILLLFMVNAAMTSVCLGISSMTSSPERASLIAVYLVGFQLPLSGAVLALPQNIAWLTRPFIASYWSWSGFIQTMRETRFYDAIQLVTQTQLAQIPLSLWVLISHVILGLFLAYTGCKASRWE
jgi:ABC transport system ATP-binding/permease protein